MASVMHFYYVIKLIDLLDTVSDTLLINIYSKVLEKKICVFFFQSGHICIAQKIKSDHILACFSSL